MYSADVPGTDEQAIGLMLLRILHAVTRSVVESADQNGTPSLQWCHAHAHAARVLKHKAHAHFGNTIGRVSLKCVRTA